MNELASKALFEAQTQGLDDRLLKHRGWILHSRNFPVLDVSFEAAGRTGIRVRMICDDWNEQPPSIQLLSLEGELLSTIKTDPAGIFNNGPHPVIRRPFICTRGSREYHTHSSHLNDHWDNYKNQSGFDLGGILTKVWRAWQKTR
jgi:hypothetical protein